jgi:hypothetical protein
VFRLALANAAARRMTHLVITKAATRVVSRAGRARGTPTTQISITAGEENAIPRPAIRVMRFATTLVQRVIRPAAALGWMDLCAGPSVAGRAAVQLIRGALAQEPGAPACATPRERRADLLRVRFVAVVWSVPSQWLATARLATGILDRAVLGPALVAEGAGVPLARVQSFVSIARVLMEREKSGVARVDA